MHNVTYEVRNDKSGFLEKQVKTFDSFKDAMTFVRSIKNDSNIVGKPVVEEN